MDAQTFDRNILAPALTRLHILCPSFPTWSTPDARRMLLAIAGQESGWTHRTQIGGPATGFWQFEEGGAVKGVLAHRATAFTARLLAGALEAPVGPHTVHAALVWNDTLAAGFARLLLWTHPQPLPTTQDAAWVYYLSLWRPGKPHPSSWPLVWDMACKAVPFQPGTEGRPSTGDFA